MSLSRAPIYLAVVALALCVAPARAQQTAPGIPHVSSFGAPRVSTLDDATVVISFEAGGDLRGLVTLTLHPNGTAPYTGVWAFTVAHMDGTDPATGEDPELEHAAEGQDDTGEEHPHHAFMTLVHQGSLAGAVSSAVVTRDADGVVTGLQAALTIDQGAAEFDGVTGTGQATLVGLNLLF